MTSTPAEQNVPVSQPSSPSPTTVPAPVPTPTAGSAKSRWGTLLACVLAVSVASAATMLVSDYWRGSLRVPLQYDGDALLYLPLVKSLHETGSHWSNPRLGAPDGFVLYDFPIPDTFHFLTLRALSAAAGDYVVGYNLFVLLQYPLAALSGAWVARQLGVKVLPAVACGVLFAYLPHHNIVLTNHIFLSAYYPVPLALWLVVRVYLGEFRVLARDPATRKLRPPYLSGDAVGAGLVCALVASTGAYFAFFTAGLLGVAAVASAIDSRRGTAAVPGVLLAGVIFAGLMANLYPSLAYQKQHGPNPTVKRSEAEGNTWALRPAELFVPPPFHREERLGKVGEKYATAFEGTIVKDVAFLSAMGIVGSLGVGLALVLGLRRRAVPGDAVRPVLTNLLVVMLLVAVVGGFGPLFNHFVSPWIRCYHRILVFIGYVGMLTVGLTLTRLAASGNRWLKLGGPALAVLLLALGLYDQTYPKLIHPYDKRSHPFRADREFVRQVEQALPDGAAVFQLPYVQYPEAGFVNEIENYTPCVGYLHSDRLRWSFGVSKGRPAADWYELVAATPADQLLPLVLSKGFSAVWVDRFGYPGRKAGVEAGLAESADGPPLLSPDGRYAVYTFARRKEAFDRQLAAGEGPVVPVLGNWGGGFFVEEPLPDDLPKRIRWCGTAGTITLQNSADYPQRCRVTGKLKTYAYGNWRLTLDGIGLNTSVPVSTTWGELNQVVTVPPGTHTLRLNCDGTPGIFPARTIVFAVGDGGFQTLPAAEAK
jgi:hypothetical protein